MKNETLRGNDSEKIQERKISRRNCRGIRNYRRYSKEVLGRSRLAFKERIVQSGRRS